MKHPPIVLNPPQRQAVETMITEVCAVRGYGLRAVNARSNHVHAVVVADSKPEAVMRTFKAYATRKLREVGLIATEVEPWSRHGSTLYLWAAEEVAHAMQYVMYGQDGDVYQRQGKSEQMNRE